MRLLILLIIGVLLYFLPTVIARFRGHKSVVAIFILNLLGAWTILLWIAAIVWAFTSNTRANDEMMAKTMADAMRKAGDPHQLYKI
jgi:hypothetical protein